MSQSIQRQAEVSLRVDTQDSDSKLDGLKAKAAALRKEFSEAFKKGDTKEIDRINREINKVNQATSRLQTNAQRVRDAMVSLDRATPKQLQNTIKMINAELNSGRVPRGTKQWQEYVAQLNRAREELRKVNSEMGAVSKTQDGIFSGIAGSFTKWWGTYTIFSDIIGGVNMKLADLKKNFSNKDASQKNLKALTGLDDESIDWLTKQAEKLSVTMDETGLRVTQSSKEILEAYMLVGSNKPELLTDKEALNAVTVETMRLSSAAQMGLKQAVDATTTALNQYSAGADQAAKYVNVLAAGSKFGAANVEQQAAAILKSGTAAASADVPIEELVGSIETLGEFGVKGEIAGTGLKKFFLTLQTGAADTNPKVVGLSTAVENLKKKVDEAESKSVGGGAAFLKKMFGEEGYSIASIISGNIEKLNAYTTAVSDTSVAMEQAAINSDSLAAKKAQLRNKLEEAGNVLIEKLNPSLGILVNWQSKLIGGLPGAIDFIERNRRALLTLAAAYAAYMIYVKGCILLHSAWNTLVKAAAALQATFAAVIKLASFAWYTYTGNTVAATRAMSAFNAACASNPVGAVIAVLTAAAVAFGMYESAVDKASKKVEVMGAVTERATLRREEERAAIEKEITSLEKFTGTQEEEAKMCQTLNNKYGTVLGTYDSVAEWLVTLKDKGDEWVNTIYKQILAEGKLEAARQLIAEAAKRRAEGEAYDPGWWETFNNTLTANWNTVGIFRLHGWETARKNVKDRKKTEAEEDAKDLENLAKSLTEEANRELAGIAPKTYNNNNDGNDPDDDGPIVFGETDEQRKAREKAEREAERKRKEELKKALDGEKAIYQKSVAETTALYSTAGIDYREYLTRMAAADDEYLKGRKKVYTDRHQEESAEYASLLREEEETKRKHVESMRKLDIKTLDRNRATATDNATSDFFDPRSAAFQNQKALDKRLLDADVEYLQAKLKLYEEGSEEYLSVEAELEKRLADDRNAKRRETAEAYMQFIERFGKSSGSFREQAETAILEELHKQGLISEEQYQKALAEIKKKYRKEDREKARAEAFDAKRSDKWEELLDGAYTSAGEFDRIIMDLYQSFHDLFDNVTYDNDSFWERFQGAATSSLAAVSAGLSMATSYMQACQDAELAKIESRYDREIEAAGNNTRKTAKLERQKEEEIARIKKRYNDRAMKMELAQAIAQTATNALGAYGAMVEIPVVGPALAAAAAAMAIAAGMVQVATIKKQHEAQAAGYFAGGFTSRDPDNRREVGIVHANEFVANHKAVANPAIAPVLRLIDRAQRSNTVGSLTADDVSHALGRSPGVSARGGGSSPSESGEMGEALSKLYGVTAASRKAIDRLADLISEGLPAYMVMDGENGFDRKYRNFQKTIKRTKV